MDMAPGFDLQIKPNIAERELYQARWALRDKNGLELCNIISTRILAKATLVPDNTMQSTPTLLFVESIFSCKAAFVNSAAGEVWTIVIPMIMRKK